MATKVNQPKKELEVKVGQAILFKDDIKHYEGYNVGIVYYKGKVAAIASPQVVRVTFDQMSYDTKKWFKVPKTTTWVNIRNIQGVLS